MLNLLNIASHNAMLLKDGRSLELLSATWTPCCSTRRARSRSRSRTWSRSTRTGALDEARALRFAAAAEHRQTHPIALAIVAEAEARGLALPTSRTRATRSGYGIKVELGEQAIQVGSERFMQLWRASPSRTAIQAQRCGRARAGHSFDPDRGGRLSSPGAIELTADDPPRGPGGDPGAEASGASG